jgi:hypothetical protein
MVQLLVHPEGLGHGVEVLVAVFGSSEAAVDCQWSSICGHPQLEVSIVWYCHESSERWSSEDGMVLRGPVDDLEFDLLLSEVSWRAKDDIEMYRP